MKAIDYVVEQFLRQPSTMKKVVMNLGAGYDPLPWQCLSRYPEVCKDVKFVDVDYKDLMVRKRQTVMNYPELNSMFSNASSSEGDILYSSDQYLQIGCDLRETSKLSKILSSVIDFDQCMILFTAEVSVTYMTTQGADSLIKWAGTLPHARFCLLEQLLPQGVGHPFAMTMMAHFNKLQTPLQSVQKYPTVGHQEKRFTGAGWTRVTARNLWDLWSDSNFLSNVERRAVDAVEPFDEWEEFALFGCHYLLLVADNGECHDVRTLKPSQVAQPLAEEDEAIFDLTHSNLYSEYPKPYQHRRFASPLSMQSTDGSDDLMGNFGGLGQTRLNSVEIYCQKELSEKLASPRNGPSPPARMCHTMVDIGNEQCLLVGGRKSPSDALADCWIYHKSDGCWERIEDIPKPVFRHSAVSLGTGEVLVMAGKVDATTILKDVYLWSRSQGWRLCNSHGSIPETFGATVFQNSGKFHKGFLFGGINSNGILCERSWAWTVDSESQMPTITFTERPLAHFTRNEGMLARFGASVTNNGDATYIVGGVVGKDLLAQDYEILRL